MHSTANIKTVDCKDKSLNKALDMTFIELSYKDMFEVGFYNPLELYQLLIGIVTAKSHSGFGACANWDGDIVTAWNPVPKDLARTVRQIPTH
ncbi:hypothetical protein RJT34_25563 [Clitoria ternatea]|uniref:Uncharacterized protein n=1 Tax=Clitoria ternatea TaxID=43366 RepID=A0AAN9FQ35_CLITE